MQTQKPTEEERRETATELVIPDNVIYMQARAQQFLFDSKTMMLRATSPGPLARTSPKLDSPPPVMADAKLLEMVRERERREGSRGEGKEWKKGRGGEKGKVVMLNYSEKAKRN